MSKLFVAPPTGAPIPCSDSLAAHRLLIATQAEIQRMLNEKGMLYRDLARALCVTEARVSQIFSEAAGNLTIKTIAKIFNRLGEEAFITTTSAVSAIVHSEQGPADEEY